MDTLKRLDKPLLTGLLLSAMAAYAAPDAVVIEQQSSQITETLSAQQSLSFTPINGTLIPMSKGYKPFQLPEYANASRQNWMEHLGQPVVVEHKQRDLSLEGTLESISGNYFTLSVKRVPARYPISDFYLVPKLAAIGSRQTLNYQGQLTYQTADLSWAPELSLVVDDNQVLLIQQANIRNQSSSSLALNSALLHYGQSANTVRPMYKSAMTSDSRMELASAPPETQYTNSEITLELAALTLPATSETLVDLGQYKAPINQRKNAALAYSYPSSSAITLNFNQQITFKSPKDLIPGQYSTLWHKKPYYLSGSPVTLENTREGANVTATLNKSLDLKGELTLITETQDNNKTTQTWELTLENMSRQDQAYEISHQFNQAIKGVSLRSLEQISANALMTSGNLAANSTYKIRYTVDLQKRQ